MRLIGLLSKKQGILLTLLMVFSVVVSSVSVDQSFFLEETEMVSVDYFDDTNDDYSSLFTKRFSEDQLTFNYSSSYQSTTINFHILEIPNSRSPPQKP